MAKSIIVVIPAFNPDNKLVNLVNELITANFNQILIVNDGSKSNSKAVFDQLHHLKECTILNHAVNLGKGRALKTAFNYVLNYFADSVGVVTVDADGQHSVKDISKVAHKLLDCENSLVLGVRNFSLKDIPFRSRFGNLITIKVYSLASGIKIADTQTGLRGIPNHFMKILMNLNGERFEYEMNMLLECKSKNITIEQVEIETIYIEANKSSHFNPIIDSIKIYSLFLKYLFSSLLSFGIDILLFSVLLMLLKGILPAYYIIGATIGARILSSLFNYLVNRNIVFNSNSQSAIIKYYTLSITQMSASAYGVFIFYSLIGRNEVLIKIAVDAVLFLLSFYIQREWVFNNKTIPSSQVVQSD
ncbi:glycosyltransferase [Bacillus marasmi]|uniref:glycosyltransferase n=1 Tax=Bacillus marasmi TaxID=1926279 RepID=UPI0011CA2605|nr:glycosyltransferase [Bacillus marasmi]